MVDKYLLKNAKNQSSKYEDIEKIDWEIVMQRFVSLRELLYMQSNCVGNALQNILYIL